MEERGEGSARGDRHGGLAAEDAEDAHAGESGGSTDGGRQHPRLAGNDGTQPGVGMATGVGGTDGERHAGLASNDRPRRRPARGKKRASFGDFRAGRRRAGGGGPAGQPNACHPPLRDRGLGLANDRADEHVGRLLAGNDERVALSDRAERSD